MASPRLKGLSLLGHGCAMILKHYGKTKFSGYKMKDHNCGIKEKML